MAINFEKYQADANEFLHDVCDAMNTDNENKAARATKAVLHALRDRLPIGEAIHFGQQLPMGWKGIYFDQLDLGKLPQEIRTEGEFVNYVRTKLQGGGDVGFPNDEDIKDIIHAVFSVLEKRIDEGQIRHVKGVLPKEIVELVEH